MRAFIDDTVRDVFFALRTFKRAPLAAFTVVATVALGLGLVAVAFTLLNLLLFRVDQVPDVHEMFAVERVQPSQGERAPFTRAQFDALRRDTGVFIDAFAKVSDVESLVDGRYMFGTFITGNAFDVLGVRAALGRVLTPADDEPSAGRPVMVLSHRGWDRLFARDPAIVGRRLLVNKVSFEVVGVMPEGFRGLAAVAPDDYWAPLSLLGDVRPIHRGADGNIAAVDLEIVGRLKRDVSQQAAVAQLNVWDASESTSSPIGPSTALRDERRLPRITVVPRRGLVEQPREALLLTAPLFFAFGLILVIGCANVANLLLARGVARQREIGIRLSLGATRRRIVRQLLTENLLLALAAAAAGLAISHMALAAMIDALTTSNIGDIRLVQLRPDWRVLLFLVVSAAVSTMIFALAPAVQATRIEPIRTMRGEVVRDARPGRARNVLIGLQVSVSALLLICAAVFLRSAFAAATASPGMRISDTVIVQITSEPLRTAMVQAVTAEPVVAAVAASWPDAPAPPRPALAETAGVKATVAFRFVSPEYFNVLDIAVVAGRRFAPVERTPNLSVAIVSETTARTLWPNANPIGRVMRLDAEPNSETQRFDERRLDSRTVTVVGVASDVAGFRMMPHAKAIVYLPTHAEVPMTSLVARVHGDPERARQILLNRLSIIDSTIDPNTRGEGQVVGAMQWAVRMETKLLQLAFGFTVALGVLALALTLSGLFSVVSYLVEQRTREIGVRMALGATTHDVRRLVLSHSIGPVAVGAIIGAASAAGLAKLLLASAGAATIGNIVQVLDPVAYAGSLLLIVAACLAATSIPATRAARLDPARTLRQQ
jgi:predicted permease